MPSAHQRTDPDPVNPDELARAWTQGLKDCDFAGQIDLSEEDLRCLAGAVRAGFENPVATTYRHAIRVVFSVNCAYYAHDGGFWEYFCEYLDYASTPANQAWLGPKIEDSLVYFGFLGQPRYGPFRWVGPLLEQAGVTLRSMHNFAEILRQAARGSWDRLLSLTFHQFRDIVDGLTPGTYLGLFLKDDSRTGWKFVRDVARSISQHERGLVSWKDLQELPGYRPGFWKELKRHLDIETSKPGPTGSQRAPLPKLIFDTATQQVQLAFDHDYVERRQYLFDGDLVDASRWPLTCPEDFKHSYRVLIKRDDDTWKEHHVRGFTLGNPEPVAIFHPQKGYIPTDAPVPLGPCYLLAPQGTSLPDSLQCLTDFEHVGIRDTEYVFWQVDIAPTSDLRSLGYTQEREPEEIISWARYGSRLLGSLEPANVFLGELPPIRLNQARLFSQNRLALFVQTGSVTERIKVPGKSDTEEVTIPLQAPSSGRIWVEPLGRQRTTDHINFDSNLTFALLPNCVVKWPSGLLSAEDRPLLSFDGPEQMSVRFPDCLAAGPGQWQVPARAAFVEGILQTQNLSIVLGRTIYRAEFADDATPEKRFFEPAEFDTEFPLHLRGLPGTPIRLGLSNTVNTIGLDLAQNFDAAGLKRVSSFCVRDALKNYTDPAGTISIWDGRTWVSSGAALLNLPALSAWLFADQQNQDPPWFPLLDVSLSAWVKEVLQALTSRAPAPPFPSPKTLPRSTQKWANEIELMLLIFAEHPANDTKDPFTARKMDHLDPELVKGLRWVWAARALVERAKSEQTSDASALISQYPQWLPPRKAWQQTMRELLDSLHLQQDLDLMIDEWAGEARPPMRTTFSSRIATQAKGRDLTEAYICSQQTNHHAAYLLTDAIEQGSPSGLVLDLALLLKNVIRVRNNLAFQAPAAPVHRKLQPYFSGLSQLAQGRLVPPPPNGELGPQVLHPHKFPLHADDIALLRQAIGVPEAHIQ
ncbi:MAG: hypothetical protein ABSA83_17000 [Verrucomicrobiota bacterium]